MRGSISQDRSRFEGVHNRYHTPQFVPLKISLACYPYIFNRLSDLFHERDIFYLYSIDIKDLNNEAEI
jgi:hypothetical protein